MGDLSILKIVPEPYLNSDALENLIYRYIYPKSYLIGGGAVNPLYAVEQMHLVKKLWCKENGRQLMHFILGYSEKESAHIYRPESILPDAYHICEYFDSEFQIIFGIHRKRDDTWHIHFVANSVSYLNGRKLPKKKMNDIDLANHIEAGAIYTDFVRVYYY